MVLDAAILHRDHKQEGALIASVFINNTIGSGSEKIRALVASMKPETQRATAAAMLAQRGMMRLNQTIKREIADETAPSGRRKGN